MKKILLIVIALLFTAVNAEVKTKYYDNGEKKAEINYKDGRLHGLTTCWYENGQKKGEVNFKNGKPYMFTKWGENGKKDYHSNYEDGELILTRSLLNSHKNITDPLEYAVDYDEILLKLFIYRCKKAIE
jgi:antitoxin component YwqK of YwqJK toxin-antitoxin module